MLIRNVGLLDKFKLCNFERFDKWLLDRVFIKELDDKFKFLSIGSCFKFGLMVLFNWFCRRCNFFNERNVLIVSGIEF